MVRDGSGVAVTGNGGATDKAAGGVKEKASWKRLLQGKLGGRGQGRGRDVL